MSFNSSTHKIVKIKIFGPALLSMKYNGTSKRGESKKFHHQSSFIFLKSLELCFHTLWQTVLNLGPAWPTDVCASGVLCDNKSYRWKVLIDVVLSCQLMNVAFKKNFTLFSPQTLFKLYQYFKVFFISVDNFSAKI